MSFPPGTSWPRLHPESFQASVNVVVYSRVGETGAWKVPPGLSGLTHASCVLALLPIVVNVGSPPRTSQGPSELVVASEPVGSVQPAGAGLAQQPTTLLSCASYEDHAESSMTASNNSPRVTKGGSAGADRGR